ncbi:unknown protein [Oryza sativa Japonica Group]|uniref:Os01g0687600 protein n=2 Tax=Oryza sativa subsp. japonica TaxID=39947 RepID=A0A979HJ27_ORYSJ|nr:serine/Arginine-related protein 53 isoform X1 [Oryza sativa Japonica Group]KAF2951721.1 hypothetical protein DAI22_01g283900 [Oryza sativa Japonica Group]BAD82543.1 unknown protein [Oryza sativa Japonica Group]BAF05828.1 Os01g0687600 [Oryza sativa Japonica Group]BAG97685.1 unnamed protein product [Oryza sativa Japonica Group]BAS73767.1 Os01g0687600 [Oryza sativa Japonica Group]|eukprot:NP_001043914.1 Os01g0687600 [Oryza sativa Japonica Group]
MEEEKAAAYYDELSRKGEGARRFKQGLGFSSSDPQSTSFPSKPPSTSSSFLSGFVRAGATPAPAQPTKQPPPPPPPPHEPSRTGRHSRSPSPSRRHRTRSSSPSRSRRHRSRSRERRRRSRSREREREDRRASRRRSRSRSRSRSPSRRSGRSSYSENRHGDRRRDDGGGRRGSSKGRGGREGGKVDYSRLIEGYDRMTPAERVKAKMKLQLSETASKDSTLGNATVGWERFEFNKDAPLDEDDNDVEVANDDASLVKHIGKSFRLSAVQSKHEDTVRDAHENAIFGVPAYPIVDTETTEAEPETNDESEKAKDVEAEPSSSLISDKVLATQSGSWRERAQKLRQNPNA